MFLKDNPITYIEFKTAVEGKGAEAEIANIKTLINSGHIKDKDDFKNIDKHIVWAIFLRFVCGFDRPILSTSDEKKFLEAGMLL